MLGFSVPPALTAGIEAEMLRAYWKSTLTKAVIAREVAERLRTGWGDDAFLAGLLADLGLLVLIQRLGEPFLKVIHRVRSAHRDLAEVERHSLGFDHVQLTIQLLRRWGLPVIAYRGDWLRQESRVASTWRTMRRTARARSGWRRSCDLPSRPRDSCATGRPDCCHN